MTPKKLHLPQPILKALQETAARKGGLPLCDVVAAAVRAFNHQDASYKSQVIREFWFGALPGAEHKKTPRR
jgi:hypothetical protein